MIFILIFKLIFLNIFIQNIIVYCVYGTNGNNFPEGSHIQNNQNTNFGQNPNVNSYMMPDSAQMDPKILDQKRKRQRQRAKKPKQPTTFINVDAANLKYYAEYFTGLNTGLQAQRMISHMQNQQSQLYPDSNATDFVLHPSTNEGPSSFDHNQHLLQNSQGNQGASSVGTYNINDNHHLTHPTNFGNQGGIGLDHSSNLDNFGHSSQHSQPWMEGHNSNINHLQNHALGTQSYLGNIHSVQQTPNNQLPNSRPNYPSGNTFGMNDNSQINSAFVPYKSPIPQEIHNPYMSKNHQSDFNSETSNTSMNRNLGKMLANEEEQFNYGNHENWSLDDIVKKNKRIMD